MSKKGYVILQAAAETKSVPNAKAPPPVELKSGAGKKLVAARKSGNKKRPSRRRGLLSAPSLPPELKSVITVRKVQRFYAASAIGNSVLNITGGSASGALGGFCTVVNSKLQTIASSLRIHRVTIWPAVGLTTVKSPEVVWYGVVTTLQRDYSTQRSLPEGVTVDRPVVSTPPKNTIAADWVAVSTGASSVLFGFLNVPAQSIIDVDFEFSITNNLVGNQLTIATGVLGTFYTLALDGPSSNMVQFLLGPTTA